MFSPMLFLLVKKMEIQFYSVSFCPPNSPKSITNSLIKFCSVMGRRQFHAGEEGQGGNFGNTRRATGSR